MMEPFLHQSTERLTLVLTETVIVSKVDFVRVHSRSHAIFTLAPSLNTIASLIMNRGGKRIITGEFHILSRLFHFFETPSTLCMWLRTDGDL